MSPGGGAANAVGMSDMTAGSHWTDSHVNELRDVSGYGEGRCRSGCPDSISLLSGALVPV